MFQSLRTMSNSTTPKAKRLQSEISSPRPKLIVTSLDSMYLDLFVKVQVKRS